MKYSPEQIQELLDGIYSGQITEYKIPKGLYEAIGNYLQEGLFKGFGKNFETAAGDDLELLNELNENIWMFSAAKSFQELKDIRSLMFDPITKKLVGAREFNALGSKAYDNWNNNWGRSEYETAVGQGQMAVYWNDIEKNKDILPVLVYDTKGNPCPDCKPYEGFSAKVDDPIWKWLYPLMHFNCGCTVRQETDSHPLSDSEFRDKVNNLKSTVPEVFQMNAGKDKYVFNPESHPYFHVEKKDISFASQNFDLPLPERVEPEIKYYEKTKINSNLTNEQAVQHLKASGIPYDFEGEAEVKEILGSIYIYADGEGLAMNRIIELEGNYIKNDYFRIEENSRYKGQGAQIFNNQVEEAAKQGYKYIKTSAAGGKGYNGFYTWARLGYEPEDYYTKNKFLPYYKKFNTKFGTNVKDFKELIGTKTGQEWWKGNGIGWNGAFKLEEGSYSRKTLKNYIDGKGKK